MVRRRRRERKVVKGRSLGASQTRDIWSERRKILEFPKKKEANENRGQEKRDFFFFFKYTKTKNYRILFNWQPEHIDLLLW